MIKNLYYWTAFVFSALLLFSSCDETEEVNRYADWRERNQVYIDSIAEVAKTNANGDWEIIDSYNYWGTNMTAPADSCIYVRKMENWEGNENIPIFTDSVKVHYRGKLRNGDIFQQTYYVPDPDPEFVAPPRTSFYVGSSGLTNGFATALQSMPENARWEVYIPWQLAYGESNSSDIPAYSVLFFDMHLVDIVQHE